VFFRNLTFFRFPASIDFAEVDTLLPHVTLKPVGALEHSSRGFISPFGREEKEQFSHRIGDALWLTVGGEERMLPASVLNDALAKRLEEIEEKEGRKLGGRERKRLKDDLLHELLPRAFVKSSRTDAFLDLQHGYAAVDTSSRRTGENVMSDIRGMLGSFPAMPLNAEVAPRAILTAWIAGEPLPDGLSLGEECQLKDPAQGGAVVKCQYQELRCDEIDKHLDAGKQVSRLALVFKDNLSFVLGEDLIVRKLKFLDGALDHLEHIDEESRRAELDARFALQSGEIRSLFLLLEQAFKLSEADPQAAKDPAPAPARDPLYSAALSYVTSTGKASVSALQRALKTGYNRAARLIEELEAAGAVSFPDPLSGARVVLASAG